MALPVQKTTLPSFFGVVEEQINKVSAFFKVDKNAPV
jgi:hypothetical protein